MSVSTSIGYYLSNAILPAEVCITIAQHLLKSYLRVTVILNLSNIWVVKYLVVVCRIAAIWTELLYSVLSSKDRKHIKVCVCIDNYNVALGLIMLNEVCGPTLMMVIMGRPPIYLYLDFQVLVFWLQEKTGNFMNLKHNNFMQNVYNFIMFKCSICL